MRWYAFATFAYMMLVLDLSLGHLLRIGSGDAAVTPWFTLLFMVYLASVGTGQPVRIAALVLGCLTDLTVYVHTVNGGTTYILGPAALGFLLGATLVFQLRAVIYRKHPLYLSLLTLFSGFCAAIVMVFLLLCHRILGSMLGSSANIDWNASAQIVHYFWVVLYTSVIALPFGWVFNILTPLFGFQTSPRMSYSR